VSRYIKALEQAAWGSQLMGYVYRPAVASARTGGVLIEARKAAMAMSGREGR